MTNPYDPKKPGFQADDATAEFGYYGLGNTDQLQANGAAQANGYGPSAGGSGAGYGSGSYGAGYGAVGNGGGYGGGNYGGNYGGGGNPLPPQQATNSLAVWALVSSFFVPLLGIILGHISLGQIKRTGQGGRGMALAGTILGYVFTVLGLVAIALFFSVGMAVDKGIESLKSTKNQPSAVYSSPAIPEENSVTDVLGDPNAALAAPSDSEIDALLGEFNSTGGDIPTPKVSDQNCAAAFDYMDVLVTDPTLDQLETTPESLRAQARWLSDFANRIEEPDVREEILAVAAVYETGEIDASFDPVRAGAVAMMPVDLATDCMAAGNRG